MVVKANMIGEADPVCVADLDHDEMADLQRQAHDARRRDWHIFSCVVCHQWLYLRQYGSRLWLFAHWPGTAEKCDLAIHEGESKAHYGWKVAIYRRAKATPGFTAAVEEPGEGIDPITRRPPIYDVVARRIAGTERPFAWEIQLSPQSAGVTLSRHQAREQFLARCCWVTTTRVAWGEQVPWTQVDEGNGPRLVVGGVKRVVRPENVTGVIYVDEDPFPLDLMVKSQLDRKMVWTDAVRAWHWIHPDINLPRRKRSASVRQTATQWCERRDRAPEHTSGWDEPTWQLAAHRAHTKLRSGAPLSDTDEAALARYPAFAVLDPVADLLAAGADIAGVDYKGRLVHGTQGRPCRWCGRPAYTSDLEGPVHPCCEKWGGSDCPHCRASAAGRRW